MRTKTAIYRNFIRTPKIISGVSAMTLWLCFETMLPWGKYLALSGLLTIVFTLLSIVAMNDIGEHLVRARFQKWASDLRGIHPDDFDDFLFKIDAEKLEEMVAWDYEGIYQEE